MHTSPPGQTIPPQTVELPASRGGPASRGPASTPAHGSARQNIEFGRQRLHDAAQQYETPVTHTDEPHASPPRSTGPESWAAGASIGASLAAAENTSVRRQLQRPVTKLHASPGLQSAVVVHRATQALGPLGPVGVHA